MMQLYLLSIQYTYMTLYFMYAHACIDRLDVYVCVHLMRICTHQLYTPCVLWVTWLPDGYIPGKNPCHNQEDPPFTEYRWVVMDYETRLVVGSVPLGTFYSFYLYQTMWALGKIQQNMKGTEHVFLYPPFRDFYPFSWVVLGGSR